MEAKKNEKMRIEKNSGLYFVLGLCLVLGLSYFALEWKTYDDTPFRELVYVGGQDDTQENIPPITTHPEPPKPKFIPIINEPLPDDMDVEESIPEFIEPDPGTEIPDVPTIPDYIEPTINETIDFIVVEEKPVFPGCESASDKYACFQEMMQKHIRRNFKYPESAITMNQQGKVYVQFTIQKDGTVDDVKLRGPYQILEKEAARIISKLPKMTPGKQRGTPVKVPFSVPINFVLQ